MLQEISEQDARAAALLLGCPESAAEPWDTTESRVSAWLAGIMAVAQARLETRPKEHDTVMSETFHGVRSHVGAGVCACNHDDTAEAAGAGAGVPEDKLLPVVGQVRQGGCQA